MIGTTAVAIAGGGREIEDGPALSVFAARFGAGSVDALALDAMQTDDGFVILGWPESVAAARHVAGARRSVLVPRRRVPAARQRPGTGAHRDRRARVRRRRTRAATGSSPTPTSRRAARSRCCSRTTSRCVRSCRRDAVRSVSRSRSRAPSSNLLYELGGQPAVRRLQDLVLAADEDERELMRGGLHLGVVVDEHRLEFGRGDFLVRNLLGVDQDIGARRRRRPPRGRPDRAVPRPGRGRRRRRPPACCSSRSRARPRCCSRATVAARRFFGAPDHDAALVEDLLGRVPLAGAFCAGEIGPVGGRNFLHGFTASVALFGRAACTGSSARRLDERRKGLLVVTNEELERARRQRRARASRWTRCRRPTPGIPGTPMALAPLAHVLFTRVMKYDATDPDWADRDRFVLSAGHASMLLYSMLYLCGLGLELDDLREFRQWGSKTPGHPEKGHTKSVEVTTGPARSGHRQRGRHRARREAPARPVRRRALQPPRVRDLQRRRLHGGHQPRSRVVRRPLPARPPRRGLRRQPHHDRRRDRADVHRRRSRPLPRRTAGTCRELGEVAEDLDVLGARPARRHGDRGPTDAARAAFAHRISVAEVPGHVQGARRSARRRRGRARQGDPRAARRPGLLRSRRRPRRSTATPAGAAGRRASAVGAAARRGRGREPRTGRGVRPLRSPDAASPDGSRSCRRGRRASRSRRASRRKRCSASIFDVVPGLIGGGGDLTGNTGTLVKDAAILTPEDASGRIVHFGIREHAHGARPRTASRCRACCRSSARSSCSATTCGRRCGSRR